MIADARGEVGPAVVDDAIAAAAIMGMNNVYYRFRHLIGKPSYGDRPARLRMNRLVKPAGKQGRLRALRAGGQRGGRLRVVHARARDASSLEGGLTEEQVHDAVRIAATIHAAAIALEVA